MNRIWFASDWSKTNHQEGIFILCKGNSIEFDSTKLTKKSQKRFLWRIIECNRIEFEELLTWMWHLPRNRSVARIFVRCRRLPKRREAANARGRTTGSAAARPPKTLSTAYTVRGGSKNNQSRRKPSFLSRCTSKDTRATTTSRVPSKPVSYTHLTLPTTPYV